MKFKHLAFLFFIGIQLAYAQESKEPGFLRAKTYLKNPLELRDPFKRRINKKKSSGIGKYNLTGIYSNITESIENKAVETLKVTGVIIGKERRALVRSGSGLDTFIIKEGMKIGPNQAEVKAILPGGVVFVEKIQNVYDQEEYLETVIPVSGE